MMPEPQETMPADSTTTTREESQLNVCTSNVTKSNSPSNFLHFDGDVMMNAEPPPNMAIEAIRTDVPSRVKHEFVIGDTRILSSLAFIDDGGDGGLSGIPNGVMIMTTDKNSMPTEMGHSKLPNYGRKRTRTVLSIAFMDGDEHQDLKQKLSKAACHLWQKNKAAITSAIAAGAGSAAGSTVASLFASSALISGFISATTAAAARERISKKTNSNKWKTSVPAESSWKEYHDIMPYF
ncbi:MAG: hypothetical protein SGBAC_001469 [Bacillariaceae sp.]